MRQKYDHPLYKPEKMLCRERMDKLIQKRLEEDPNLLWDEQKQEMLLINHKDKRIAPADYLTVAHMACMQGNTKLVLAKPSE